jgi:hypothetical protein
MKSQITALALSFALCALIAPMLALSIVIALACLSLPCLALNIYLDSQEDKEDFNLNSSAKIIYQEIKAQNDWNYQNYLDCVELCYTIEQKQIKPKAKRKSRAKVKTLSIVQELQQLDNSFKFAFTI